MKDLQQRIDWWDREFSDLHNRAIDGEQNLQLAAAMCVGAITALRDLQKDTAVCETISG